jgi:hypothetical protein
MNCGANVSRSFYNDKGTTMHCGHVTLCREKMHIVVYSLFTVLNSDRIITLTFQLLTPMSWFVDSHNSSDILMVHR